jgi:diguanylate cyclase (GGDEF)-like protein/PAS domain S-box-containing protein
VLKNNRIELKLGMAFAVLIAMFAGIGQSGLRRMEGIDESFIDSLLPVLAAGIAFAIVLFANRKVAHEIAARIAAKREIAKLNLDLEERVMQRAAELREAIKHQNWQTAALEAAANAIVIADSRGTIVWVNHAFTTMTGYSKEEVMGENPRLLKSGEQPEAYYAKLWSTISSGKVWHGEIVNRRKDGTKYTEEMTITPVTQGVGDLAVTQFIAIKQDITERKCAELTTNLLASIVDSSDDAMISKNLVGVIRSWNKGAERLFGYSAKVAIGRHITLIVPLDRLREEATILERIGRGEQIEHFETVRLRKDGTSLDISLTVSPIKDISGRVVGASKVARGIGERKHAEETLRLAEEKYRTIFEDAVIGVFQTTPDGRPLKVNRALAQMHGYDSPEQLLAEGSNVALQLFVDSTRMDELRNVLDEKGIVRGTEMEVHRRDGTRRFARVNVRAVRDDSGKIILHEGTVEDITDRRIAEERVQFLAYYDALTGLPNRALAHDRLATALASARRRKEKVAILFLDLDRFKITNDSLGHAFGDLLLHEVAERLKKSARELDTVARLGGDEFLIILPTVKDVADAAVAADRIMKSMTAGFVIEGHTLSIGCSVGISVFPEHGADGETLIKNADAAMCSAKENGRNTFRFFTDEMNAQVVERLTFEKSLRLALDKRELFLVYQPQMEIATGRITGLEALLRWQHPELGLVPPDKFIRIAENSGLIMPIGEWVLRTACSQARKWQDEGLLAVPVAVNVSAVQFRQERFCDLIRAVLCETGLDPQYLELELTESLLLSTADMTFSVLKELETLGLRLTIDDFGTGYSSLSYLKQFPVNKLKIDRSFIRDITANPDDAAITTAIISMAKSLNLRVIAEGVENEEQMSFLRAHQCDEIQGYYFSKPLAVDKVADKLRGASVQHALSANP